MTTPVVRDTAAPGTMVNPGNYCRCANCGTSYVPMSYEGAPYPCPGCGK